MLKKLGLVTLLGAFLVLGCSDDDKNGGNPDGSVGKETGAGDKGPKPDKTPPKPTKLTVGAVQYSEGDYAKAKGGCKDDICGLTYYINEGVKQGATLIVTPEYSQDQKYAEQAPKIGDKPATDAKWKSAKFLPAFAKLADEKNITLILNLVLQEGSDTSAKLFNASVALDKDGKVIARHYKFELFGGESKQLTVGPNINTSLFDTPAGKAAILICADAQCIVTKLSAGPSCSAHAVKMLKELFLQKKPKIVLFSAAWTIPPGNAPWGSIEVIKQIAENNVWVVAAGNTRSKGPGGGVWKPGGTAVKSTTSTSPSVIVADIPIGK